jgi:hypothetical protein
MIGTFIGEEGEDEGEVVEEEEVEGEEVGGEVEEEDVGEEVGEEEVGEEEYEGEEGEEEDEYAGVDQSEWQATLKSFLDKLLKDTIVKSDAIRGRMLSDDNMKVWYTAFTHESYNPNRGSNYEELELLGDQGLSYAFTKLLLKVKPGISNREATKLEHYYLKKGTQAGMSELLGLPNYVRSNMEIDVDTKEDVMEAFFGALDKTGDAAGLAGKNRFPGLGAVLMYNMTYLLYGPDSEYTPIDFKYSVGDPKTRFLQLFERLRWTTKESRYNRATGRDQIKPILGFKVHSHDIDGGQVSVTLEFTPRAHSEARQIVPTIAKQISTGVGPTQKDALTQAYDRGLEYIRGLGIDKDYVNKYRRQFDLEDEDIAPLLQKVNGMVGDKYADIYLTAVKKEKNNVTVQLIGQLPSGRTKVLSTSKQYVKMTEREAKIDALHNFLSGYRR